MYYRKKSLQPFVFFYWYWHNISAYFLFFICHTFCAFYLLYFVWCTFIVSLCLSLRRVSNDEKRVADNCREYLADGQTNRLLDRLLDVLTYRVNARTRLTSLDHVLLDRAFIISVVSTTMRRNNPLWKRDFSF